MQKHEKIDFNVKFSGDYHLFKWILLKYKNALPYDSFVSKYASENFYSPRNTWFWDKQGISTRTWNALHKDLTIARLLGRIADKDAFTLEQLKEEYLSQSESGTLKNVKKYAVSIKNGDFAGDDWENVKI